MDIPFLKLASYFLLLFTSFNFAASDSELVIPSYFDHNCTLDRDNFTSNSPYQFNLNTVLFSLSSYAAGNDNTGFHNTTDNTNTNDTVYGQFMCRGDVPHQVCQDCVEDAAYRIPSECPYSREAIIWYDVCLLRYSDRSFFSTLDELPIANTSLRRRFCSDYDRRCMTEISTFKSKKDGGSSTGSVLKPTSTIPIGGRGYFKTEKDGNFSSVLNKTLNDAVEEAAKSGPAGSRKFATKEANVSDSETVYVLVQCTPDLSPQFCSKCLHDLMELIPWGYVVSDGRILNPSCNLRFDSGRFYYKGNEPPSSGFSSNQEIDFRSIDFMDYNCSAEESFSDDTYQNKLINLTQKLSESSNISKNNGFYNISIIGKQFDAIYGLFMCRGDVSLGLCRECVDTAIERLNYSCPSSKQAIILYDMCMFRYSNRSFSPTLDTQFIYAQNGVDLPEDQKGGFNRLLANTLNELVAKIKKPGSTGAKNFATYEVNSFSELKRLYSLAQCTPDMSSDECVTCLQCAQDNITQCCLGKQGGSVMYLNCNLRFELYRFYYNNSAVLEPSAPEPSASKRTAHPPTPVEGIIGKNKGQSRTIIIVVVPTIVSVMLFWLGYYCWQRKQSGSYKAILKRNFGEEGATLESLQFSLTTIEAATKKFSTQNRIGKGGFGEVYKGILPDGKEIAVKRLSESSRQGLLEFKNEVLLIAKLQHRNLVALLGFCLKDQEKILVYEYVPNKSLDYFLFGSQKARALNWPERFKIIRGIAGGILYLHEHSRLKVIHRDLKPSNILLDDEMNPKISDFGTARMVGINETRGSTNRIVGTLGYMSPEYVKFGLFSEKSDVFSFGVMILEIVCGKKNVSLDNESHGSQYADGLLSHAWKHWRDEKLTEIFDSDLAEADSHSEIIKCIQIGLLCVQGNSEARPSMGRVVQYLSNDSIQLPSPQEPAFFIHGQMEVATSREMEVQLANHSQCSVNEMSESISFPR